MKKLPQTLHVQWKLIEQQKRKRMTLTCLCLHVITAVDNVFKCHHHADPHRFPHLLRTLQIFPVQIKKIKDGIFSFQLQKKCFCQTLTDDARRKNVPPHVDLTRISKSYHKRNDRRKFLEKRSNRYHVR